MRDYEVDLEPRDEKRSRRPSEPDELAADIGHAIEARRPDVVGTTGLLHMQRKAGNSGVASFIAQRDEEQSPVKDVIRSKGSPLDSDTRSEMEARLGHDFGDGGSRRSRRLQAELTPEELKALDDRQKAKAASVLAGFRGKLPAIMSARVNSTVRAISSDHDAGKKGLRGHDEPLPTEASVRTAASLEANDILEISSTASRAEGAKCVRRQVDPGGNQNCPKVFPSVFSGSRTQP